MLDLPRVQKLHKPDERAARVSVTCFDHLDLARRHASPLGKAGLSVAAAFADRFEGGGVHTANAIAPATSAPTRKPANKRAGTRPFKSGMVISTKENGAEAPCILGEKEILFLEAMTEPTRGRILAGQVCEQRVFRVALRVEAETTVRTAPFVCASVLDEHTASERGKLNEHGNLLSGMGGIARSYATSCSLPDDTVLTNNVRAVNRKRAPFANYFAA